MRSRVVGWTLVLWLLVPLVANAAASRGGGRGFARAGGQTGGTGASVGQFGPQARVFSPSQVTIQQSFGPGTRDRAFGFAAGSSSRHSRFGAIARHPHPPHHHHGFFLHRHRHFLTPRGIVIIGTPGFFGSTIITHAVPGSRWAERPFATSPLADSRLARGELAPFDPMPQEIVERLLVLAELKKDDVVYDLGSGDGRVVVAAASQYGAQAVGFEIDPGLVKLARENVRKTGVEELVQIREQDLLTADLSAATVVTLYLSRAGNEAVKPLLLKQLKPGARVVSYTFDMGDWAPKIVESYRDAAGKTHLLYLWEIAEPSGVS
jgi:protein-L-isoaspartate O-methyltransferase